MILTMEKKGSLLLSFLIICLWTLSITIHQSLYFLFVFLGLYYTITKSWHIKFNYLTTSFTFLLIGFSFITLIHFLVSFEITYFNIKGVMRYFSYFFCSILVVGFSANSIKTALNLIIRYIALTTPWGIYNAIGGDRYYNIFDHPNHFAYVIVLLLAYLVYDYKKIAHANFLISLLFLNLILTKSSGGIITALTFLSIVVFIKFRVSFVKKTTIVILLAITLVAIFSFSEKVNQQWHDLKLISLDYIIGRALDHQAGGQGSFLWRLTFWSEILIAFSKESFSSLFFGLGADSLNRGNFAYDFMFWDPHNDFIKILVEFGILGLLVFLTVIGMITKYSKMGSPIFVILFLPMFFGNIIVNFPYILTLVLVLMYFYKKTQPKTFS
jgi:O-antigen ligase